MSEETTLADLLQLNLHNYEDEVRNIVDKAVKESGMEKVGGAGSIVCATWDQPETAPVLRAPREISFIWVPQPHGTQGKSGGPFLPNP